MGYVIAAYAVALGALAAYGLHLERQRRGVRRELEGSPHGVGEPGRRAVDNGVGSAV